MTDGSSGKPTPEERQRRGVDRGREVAGEVARTAARWSRTLWKWLRALWGRLFPVVKKMLSEVDTSTPLPKEGIERRNASDTIEVRAQGHIFTFTVRAIFTWSSTKLSPEQLRWYADYYRTHATDRLRALATERAKAFPPDRAGDLEAALRQAVADGKLWPPFGGEALSITCRPEVWVRLDQRVRAILLPYWEQLIDLECQNKLNTRRAEYAERLNRRWMTIMDEAVDHLATSDAAQAINEEALRVKQRLIAEQQANEEWREGLRRDAKRLGDFYDFLNAVDIVSQRSPHEAHTESGTSTEAPAAPTDPAPDADKADAGSPSAAPAAPVPDAQPHPEPDVSG